MAFELEIPPKMMKVFRKLQKKDIRIWRSLQKVLNQILERPTEVGEPKKYWLKGCRSKHIESYILLWTVEDERVKIVLFDHHDHAYG